MTHALSASSGESQAQVEAPPLLSVRGLNVRFGHGRMAEHAVRGLSFDLARGRTLALVGESGCGKSSTALAIMGLLPPHAGVTGSILFDGQDLLAMPERALRGLRGRAISMIFQEPMTSLNPVHAVGEQVAEVLRAHLGMSSRAARQRSIQLLDLVQIPEPHRRAGDYPHQLSGGQRQRVMIAMAVACQPRLLVADEPTTALDVTIQSQILALLGRLRRDLDMSLLLITHDLGIVAEWADEVAVMYAGERLEAAPVEQLFTQPAHPYSQALLGSSLHWGQRLHYRSSRLAEIHAEGGSAGAAEPLAFRLVRPVVPASGPSPLIRGSQAVPLLEVRGLCVAYERSVGKPVRAVNEVSCSIGHGETLALVGESGCGKSSIARALLRLIPIESGQIVFDGTDIARLPERELRAWRRQVQMVFQDPFGSLNPRHSVGDILDAVLRVHGESSAAARTRRMLEMLERVGLSASAAARFPNEFSGGQRQRIGIARALVLRPRLVVLDEPVSALDVSIQAQILNLLAALKDELGLAYLFISHDLSVVRYIADRVHVMRNGRLIETGTPDGLWSAPREPYTRSLLEAAPRIRFAPPQAAACLWSV